MRYLFTQILQRAAVDNRSFQLSIPEVTNFHDTNGTTLESINVTIVVNVTSPVIVNKTRGQWGRGQIYSI